MLTDTLSVGAVRHALAELTVGVSHEPHLSADELFRADRGVHEANARALGACVHDAFREARRTAATREQLTAALSAPSATVTTEDIVGDLADACFHLSTFARRAARATPAALADLLGFFVTTISAGDDRAIAHYMDGALGQAPRIAATRGGPRRRRPRRGDMRMEAPSPDTTLFLGEDGTRQRLLGSGDAFLVINQAAGVVRTLGTGASHDVTGTGGADADVDGLGGSVVVCVRTGERFRVEAGTGAPITRRGAGGDNDGDGDGGGMLARLRRRPVAAVLTITATSLVVSWLVNYFTGTGGAMDAAQQVGSDLAATTGALAGLGMAVLRGLARLASAGTGLTRDVGAWLLGGAARLGVAGLAWTGRRFSDLLQGSAWILAAARNVVGMPVTAIAATLCGQLYAGALVRVPWASKWTTMWQIVEVFLAVKSAHTLVVGALGAMACVAGLPPLWASAVVGTLGTAAVALAGYWLQRKAAPGIEFEEGHYVTAEVNADPQATVLNRAAIDMARNLVGARFGGGQARAALSLARNMEGCCLMLDCALDTAFIPQRGTPLPVPRPLAPSVAGPGGKRKKKQVSSS